MAYVQAPPGTRPRGAGNESGAVSVCYYLPADLAAAIESLARKRGMKVSAFMRQVLSHNREIMREVENLRPLELIS
jgi:hypothetical protein